MYDFCKHSFKTTRPLFFILLTCVLTSSQMFPNNAQNQRHPQVRLRRHEILILLFWNLLKSTSWMLNDITTTVSHHDNDVWSIYRPSCNSSVCLLSFGVFSGAAGEIRCFSSSHLNLSLFVKTGPKIQKKTCWLKTLHRCRPQIRQSLTRDLQFFPRLRPGGQQSYTDGSPAVDLTRSRLIAQILMARWARCGC